MTLTVVNQQDLMPAAFEGLWESKRASMLGLVGGIKGSSAAWPDLAVPGAGV